MSSIQEQITNDMKAAMRAKEKERLLTLRSILAAFKQYEVDKREAVSDQVALGIIDKLAKQRRESIKQFTEAKRDDLVVIEEFELELIQAYLPQALSDSEINDLVRNALTESGATSIKDMGSVMAILKPQCQGRADMTAVSKLVKDALSS